ncbi:MAG TPA: hypothetical protein VF765_16225 [Polyangiaceae bacterium]
MVAQGVVSRRQADRLTDDEIVEMWRDLRLLQVPPGNASTTARASSARPEAPFTQPTREDVQNLTAAIERLTTVIAAAGARRARRVKAPRSRA